MRPSTGKQHDAQLTVPLPSVTIQLGMSQGVKGLEAETPRDTWHHGEKGDTHFPTNPRGIHSGRSPQTNQIPWWDNAGPHTLQPRLKMLQRAKILCLEEEKPSKKNRWHCLPQQPPSKLKAARKENQAPPRHPVVYQGHSHSRAPRGILVFPHCPAPDKIQHQHGLLSWGSGKPASLFPARKISWESRGLQGLNHLISAMENAEVTAQLRTTKPKSFSILLHQKS